MTDIVNIFNGRIGDSGTNGENGTGVSVIRESVIDNPVLDILHNNNLSNTSALTWTRAGEALIEDRYGNFEFVTGDDITNILDYSNDFTQWSDFTTSWTATSTGNADPEGGSTATHFSLDITTSSGGSVLESILNGLVQSTFYTVSFWFKVISGTITGLEVITGATDVFKVDANLGSGFQRVSVTFASGFTGNTTISITPIGVSGATFSIWEVMAEPGSSAHDIIKTTGAPVTISNPDSPSRSSDKGYLIEDQATNLILFSEKLDEANWSIAGGTVAEYQDADPFGGKFQDIQIEWALVPTMILSSTGVFTDGVEYTVSAFVFISGGSVTSLTASLAGGAPVSFDEPSIEGFTRLTVKVTAGSSGGLDVTGISPSANATMIITGVQAELGDLSSYIRNGGVTTNVRPEDDVNLPYDIGRPDSPWTLIFRQREISVNSDLKYIISNGLSTTDEFSVYLQSSLLKINIGGVITNFTAPITSEIVALSYDGANIKMYLDGIISDTQSNSGSVFATPVTLYIGSDQTSANSINAFLDILRIYDTELNSDEIRYAAGV